MSDPLDRPAPSPGTTASPTPDDRAGTDAQADADAQAAEPASSGPAGTPMPGHRPSGSTTPATPTYKGEPLDAERGPGLGCFWIQVVVLGTLLVLTPLTVAWGWDERISAALLILTLILLLFAGQTVIFLLRLVAADRRTRRHPMGESARKTVGQLEDEAPRPIADETPAAVTDPDGPGPTAAA